MGLASITNNIITDTSIPSANVITGTLASGQVAYGSAANTIAGSNNLFWSGTALGVGTNTPSTTFHVSGSTLLNGAIELTPTIASGDITIGNGGYLRMGLTRFRGFSTSFVFQNNAYSNVVVLNTGGGFTSFVNGAGNYGFGTDIDDGINRLQVAGSARIGGSLTVAGNGSFNSGGYTTLSLPANNYFAHDAVGTGGQLVLFGQNVLKVAFGGSNGLTINPSAQNSLNTDGELTVATRKLNNAQIYNALVGPSITASGAVTAVYNATGAISLDAINNITGAQIFGVRISNTLNALTANQNIASYTGFNFSSTINQAAGLGLTGITRGVHINPTITAAADFRAIEWSNNAATAPAVSWGLYGAGTAPNYMAGALSIGVIGGSQGLRIGRAPTSADATSNLVNVAIPVTSTSIYRAFASSIGLNTSGFTLPNLSHFEAIQDGAFTAGVVTNHYGFRVNALTDGTNVYAFHSNIGAATNRWNLYMAGTAANYLNGNTIIGGTATDDGINKLQVTGSILATTNSTISGLSVGKGAGNIATNTALGASALITNSTGVQNTAIGNEALRLNTTGLQNSAFGYRSSRATTTGAGNASFGIDTLRVNSIGNYNSAFGAQALDNNTADNNTATGSQALLDNTTGTNNTALGYRAGYAGSLLSNVTGSNNIFIGADSVGESTSASNRTFIGNTSTASTWLGGRLLLGSRTDDTANRLQVTGASALVGTTYVNTNASIAGYNHSLQVLANAAGGMIVSTTNSASAIGIVNSASANKTWDISPNGNDLAINESGVATRMYFVAGGNTTIGGITNSGNLLEVLGTFKTTGVNTLSNLGGVGSRMVVADANGVLSTQAIPGGSITGTGVAGQVTYWTGASSQAGNAGFTFSPGNKLFLNNTVVAATNVARGFHITSQLSAFASNDDLVGIDLSPVYTTSGLPANVHTIGIRTASSFTPSQTDIRYTAFSIQPSINQTGTATGITRGIHINPTLTAVVDWRSVEWSNNTGWGIYGAGSAQNLLNGKLTVSPTILAANFTNANTISVLASQVLNIPTGNRGADGNVYSAVTGANYFRFNGATTLFGDSLWSGSVSISNIQFDTTGTITMANSATTGYRPLSVMQLQMQASGANNGTVDKGATLFIQGVYPASLTGTVTFTDYAAVRINDLREWGGTTVVLTNRWGIYQAGADDKNYFAASVGVGVATPNVSAKLQVDSTTQGFLPPRMTTTQRNAIVSPAAGLIVYDTDLNIHYGYNGTTWNAFY